jgi:signal transduction histidine kinase
VKAAAIMHDTVLNHLSAIAAGTDGKLNPQLRSEIAKDLTVLIGEEWLNDPMPAADDQSRSDWRRSALLAAVQEARDLPMTVDVTGDLGAIGRLTNECDIAVGQAVKQCLVNVLRHAQVARAEVAVIGSEWDVSIMVIDAGRGFSEQLVASDRLGLRQSVRRRIEGVNGEVRLWSTPGRGTSVLIRVPAERAAGAAGAAGV